MPEETKVNDLFFDVDKVIQYIGPLGTWQCIQSCILFFVGVTAGIGAVTFAFTGYVPEHRCLIPQCDNQNSSYGSFYGAENCKRLDVNVESCQMYLDILESNVTKKWVDCPRNDLIYDQSVVKSSITQDFGLVCDQSYERSLFSSLFTVGLFLGSFLVGFISDYFGRKIGIISAISFISISGLSSTLIKHKLVFALTRIVYGIGAKGCMMVNYVMAAESTVPSHKVLLMFISGIGFQVGELFFAIEAYFIRDWIPLQLASHFPMLALLFIAFFFMPESARWLISKGKVEKAKIILNKRSKMNGRNDIPENLFDPPDEKTQKIVTRLGFSDSIKAILKNKKLLLRTLNIFMQWFAAFIGYYGTLYASTSLSGDPHLNFLLAMISGVPGNFLYLLLPDRIGRKATFILSELTLGLCCIGTGTLLHFNAYSPLQVTFSMIGRFVASVSIKLCYLCTAELYPTSIRNTAVGLGSVIGGLGAIFGFLLEILQPFWIALPIVIVGSVNIVASILVLFLPETKGAKLPESIEEIM